MKDRQTPTVHVRDLIRTRSLIEGFTPMFLGSTPSVEILSSGAEIVRVGNRSWPLVEIVDRSEEPPGSGVLAARVVAALRATVRSEERSFLFTSHRMVDQVTAEVNAKLGMRAAEQAPTDAPVIVGTERDLAGLDPMALTVSLNTDGMLLSSGYRTGEEALRALARLANALAPGSGRRMMVQTFEPKSALVETLRRGDPIPYLEDVLVERARMGMPPANEVIALEIRGEQPDGVSDTLSRLPDVSVIGPLQIDEGRRWLLQGSLGRARLELRPLVGHWRGERTHVRVDSDPIDL
jgi:primosomal protein N'